ncbi:HIRAN domain-containing protein [Brunnivagina elsteri]|uniref:DNA-binding protein n=1 Tax=Brunnivagina elsteri CCALA 953 TaxID=987040 RepID=A0A2A2TLE7_9CYAN|nr:HIRAN domain-containing protein [Calothrix elsteri]PAX58305.1 DNA-binding protein [Calothrix elsteri CCALA 953]
MKTATPTLFLAWQDPISRYWFSIGRLIFDGSVYKFVYTQGVKEAEEKSAFKPLSSFPRLDEIYTSTQLFPVFANRLMSRSRPDYQRFIEWLNLANINNDPMTILARSGGERETDTLAVFPCPEVDEQGQYHLYFFSHGLRHLPSSAVERVNQLESGEKLWLAHEFQNPYDSHALILNTEDHYIVGYCPRYLLVEIFELLRHNSNLDVRVERVNQPSTPLQFRLLCKMTVDAIDDCRLFSGSQYQPLVAEIAATAKSI